MIIVLTSERPIENEAKHINQLFEEGLQILHFRKPTFDIEGYRELLQAIDSKYYHRIMLHQYHELCEEFTLRGIHIQEQPRIDLGSTLNDYVMTYKNKGYKVSSSFHTKGAIHACATSFEYVLLSPVFSSISKVGYEGKGFNVNDMNTKIIGMGGINATTLQATLDLGFKGVGVLGGIWNVADPIESFKEIHEAYQLCLKI